MLSTKEVMAKYVGLGENKVKNSIGKTILLAIIAGFFIALAGVGANMIEIGRASCRERV